MIPVMSITLELNKEKAEKSLAKMNEQLKKLHVIKTVIVREGKNGLWQVIAKRGKKLIDKTKPEMNLKKALEYARREHCGFEDEPSEPIIEHFDDSNKVEKALTGLGEWFEKVFDKVVAKINS